MASTTMQATLATNATEARIFRDVSSVSATNDGTTASGLTIVIRAMKERVMTRVRGMFRGPQRRRRD